METTILDAALTQGIWAVIAVFLLIYVVKENQKMDKRQEEREVNYQTIITKLTEEFGVLKTVREDVAELKEYMLAHKNGRQDSG